MRSSVDLVVAADWGVGDSKCWSAAATWTGSCYVVDSPEEVSESTEWFGGILAFAKRKSVLVGFDAPIGVPAGWLRNLGLEKSFRELLPELGTGEFDEFFEPSNRPSPRRPFYPALPTGSSHAKLIRALEVKDFKSLLRRCDLTKDGKQRAGSLFWLVGRSQVGKAAISLWRTVLQPNWFSIRVWPLDGDLEKVARVGMPGVCEIYPAESLTHLVPREFRGSKRSADARVIMCRELRLEGAPIAFSHRCALEMARGFESEDSFDAFIGLLSMLLVVLGEREAGPPAGVIAAKDLEIEGWILGLNGN